jgi:hypothetical protein
MNIFWTMVLWVVAIGVAPACAMYPAIRDWAKKPVK